MNRKTYHLDVRVEPEFLSTVDAWRRRQRPIPSRAAAVTMMITWFLDREDEAERARLRPT